MATKRTKPTTQNEVPHVAGSPVSVPSADERGRRIAELAYQRAEQRGFAPGGDVDDWLAAERELDASAPSA